MFGIFISKYIIVSVLDSWSGVQRVDNMGRGNTTRGWGILQGDGNTRGVGYYRGHRGNGEEKEKG